MGGIPFGRVVAAGAADGGIDREPRIKIELAAQFDLGPRERIFFQPLDLRCSLREPQWEHWVEFLEVCRIGQPTVDLFERDQSAARHAGGQRRISEHHLLPRCGCRYGNRSHRRRQSGILDGRGHRRGGGLGAGGRLLDGGVGSGLGIIGGPL